MAKNLTVHEFLNKQEYAQRLRYFEHQDKWLKHGRWRFYSPSMGTTELKVYLDGKEFLAPLVSAKIELEAGGPIALTLKLLVRSIDFDAPMEAKLEEHDAKLFGPDVHEVIREQGVYHILYGNTIKCHCCDKARQMLNQCICGAP